MRESDGWPRANAPVDQEAGGRHQHERHGVVHRAQPRADQAHVVVQRQPADEPIARRDGGGAADRPEVRKNVCMTEDDALRVARASGRVLQKCRIGGAADRSEIRAADCTQAIGTDHPPQLRQFGSRHASDEHGFGHRDQQRGATVRQDRGTPAHMLLDLRPAHRRIQRHGHGTDEQRAQEHLEERRAGWQHDRHCVATDDSRSGKSACDCTGIVEQPRVGDRLGRVVAGQQRDVLALRMTLEVPAERVHEGRGLRGRAFDFRQGKRSRLAPGDNARRTLGLANGGEEVARRARGARKLLGQADAECALDAQDQLGSRQAVESEIAVDRVVEVHHPRARTRPQLLEHRRDQLQQALGVFVRRRRRPRCVISSQHGNPDGRPCTRRRPRTAPTVSRIVEWFEYALGLTNVNHALSAAGRMSRS